jgi:spore coat polysaccharide biosynthesis protein SpsF
MASGNTSLDVSAIIQARMGSTRLPGKVLMNVNGETMLSSLLKQLSYSKLLSRKIIATTTNHEDDIIENFAKSNNVELFRGSSHDVLDRYYQCAKSFSLQHIVRITADNPLIDPEIVDEVISLYNKSNFDYVNNFTKRTFPYGTEVEIFPFTVLEKVWKNATTPYDREHVTPYIYNNPNEFSLKCMEHDINFSHLRWTVDRMEDLEFVRSICSKIKKRPILLKDIFNTVNN